MAKRLPDPYYPTNPPENSEGWPRWMADELYRIRNGIYANPVAFSVEGIDQPINISPVIAYSTIGNGALPSFEFPEGLWDPSTAEITIPQDGLYQVIADVVIAPFGAGNKAYYGVVRVILNGGVVTDGLDSGVDDVPVSINLATPVNTFAGDVLRFEVGAEHSQFTGASTYDFRLALYRIAG